MTRTYRELIDKALDMELDPTDEVLLHAYRTNAEQAVKSTARGSTSRPKRTSISVMLPSSILETFGHLDTQTITEIDRTLPWLA